MCILVIYISQNLSFRLLNVADPMNSMVDEKNHERGREPLPEKQTYTKNEPKIPKKVITSINDKKDHLIQLKSVDQVTEPSKTESGPRISQKPTLVQNSNNKSEFRNNPYWKISNKSPSISTVQDVSIMSIKFLQFSTSSFNLHLTHVTFLSRDIRSLIMLDSKQNSKLQRGNFKMDTKKLRRVCTLSFSFMFTFLSFFVSPL